MKLLFVIDSLGSGGAQRQMVNLSIGLVARGHDVEIFTYFPQYEHFLIELLEKGIVIHKNKKKFRFSITPAIRLRQLIKLNNYDAVLAFLSTPSFYAEIACLGMTHPPLVVSERSIIYPFRSDSLKSIFQSSHILADWVVVNSHHTRLQYINKYPWIRSKICTIYNGVDLDRFTLAKNSTPVNSKLKLLAIGNVVPNKNPIGLARAIAYCRDQLGIYCQIDWAGKGTGEILRKDEYIRVNKIIKELHLENQWTWLGERKDIVDLLHSHDALIHPSFYEGLSNAICEALACGRPVLASSVGDNKYLIGENQRGFLFDPNDINSIASTISKFARLSTDKRWEMGIEARRFAENELNLEKYIQNYENLFKKLTEKHN